MDFFFQRELFYEGIPWGERNGSDERIAVLYEENSHANHKKKNTVTTLI